MLVRTATPDEYERAGRVVVSAYQALPGGHLDEGYTAELADVANRAIGAEVLVALHDGVIGCVTFVPDRTSPWAENLRDGEAGVRMLGVDPATQGRGAGRSLLGACVERAVGLGRAAVFLHSTPWMPAAHRLYTRAGFVRAPERDWAPTPQVPLLAFRLDLGPERTDGGLPL